MSGNTAQMNIMADSLKSTNNLDKSVPPQQSSLRPAALGPSKAQRRVSFPNNFVVDANIDSEVEQLTYPPRPSNTERRRSMCSKQSSDDTGNQPHTEIETKEKDKEFRKIDRHVLGLRFAVVFTLLAATATVGSLTHWYIDRDERDDFEHEYQSSVIKVAEGFQAGVNVKRLAAQTFSAMYTSRYGDDQSGIRTWPNATMPDFQEQASGQLELADSRALSFNPVITDKNRVEWEAHATESAYIFEEENLVKRQNNESRIVADGIFRAVSGERVDDPGLSPQSLYNTTMVPVWQIAPIEGNAGAVMFNLHAEPNRQRALDDTLTYNVPTLTAAIQLVQDTEERPSSILFYPVRASFHDDPSAGEVVGSISIVFSWDNVLISLLPDYLTGIICVLEDSIGQEFTYYVAGEEVNYMGKGDLHDSAYDDMVHRVNATIESPEYVDNLITYHLRIYPSKEFEDNYVTNRAVIFTCGAVLIFVCTAALFLLYDYLVRRRQSKLAAFAERTSRIVNSMFPAAFRDRLFQQHDNQVKPKLEKRTSIISAITNASSIEGKTHLSEKDSRPQEIVYKSMNKFLRRTAPEPSNPDHNLSSNEIADAPIADLFTDTSIMFCDLVGFTAWSSSHTPNEVFRLLETLFWEFDQLAAKYKIFKLGTIGDCYIAVTGLPQPMDNHASALAEFTIECKKKVKEVQISHSMNLDMRFGIHSGAVVAGILRGQKSRFELFGDTINTASRMESTSQPNCIQVSKDTADLLRAEGMEDCLVPREDRVHAKGKGKLSTFWLVEPIENFTGADIAAVPVASSNKQDLQPTEESSATIEISQSPKNGEQALFHSVSSLEDDLEGAEDCLLSVLQEH